MTTTPNSLVPGDDTGPARLATAIYRRLGGVLRIELAGEIDMTTVDVLRDCLTLAAAERPVRLELDLSGVTFLGSAGIGALAGARRLAGDLVLVGGSAQVRRVLSLFDVIPG